MSIQQTCLLHSVTSREDGFGGSLHAGQNAWCIIALQHASTYETAWSQGHRGPRGLWHSIPAFSRDTLG